MDANFVSLIPIKEIDIALKFQDEIIQRAADAYIKTLQEVNQLKADAEDRHLSGSPGTIYLKKMGHRALTVDDINQLIEAKGSDEQRAARIAFVEAQESLSRRLKPLSQNIRMILEQAEIPYPQYYKRLTQPDLWKPEQMLRVIEVLDRLRT